MTVMKEKAIDIIGRLPERKLYYVVQLLESVEGLSDAVNPASGGKTVEQLAYEDLQKYRQYSDIDIDYKAELGRARDEKYANIS